MAILSLLSDVSLWKRRERENKNKKEQVEQLLQKIPLF